jgi:hypothetical protein
MPYRGTARAPVRAGGCAGSICPGAIRTPLDESAWATPEAYSALMGLVPYKRIGRSRSGGCIFSFRSRRLHYRDEYLY